eukprot:1457052-Lingulodinium_polyedra.AAC.1
MPSSKARVEKDCFCPVTRLTPKGHAAALSTAFGSKNRETQRSPRRSSLTDAARAMARETN